MDSVIIKEDVYAFEQTKYTKALTKRSKLVKELHGENQKQKELKELFQNLMVDCKTEKFIEKPLDKFLVDDLKKFQKEHKDSVAALIQEKNKMQQQYNRFKQDLTNSKDFSQANKAMQDFLKSYNTRQNSRIKRAFGIDKNPLIVTKSDQKTLIPLVVEYFQPKIDTLTNELHSLKKEENVISCIASFKQSQKVEKLAKTNFSKLIKDIDNREKELKVVVEKLIDLDFKGIKIFIESRRINIRELLLFIKEMLLNLKKKTNSQIHNINTKPINSQNLKSLEKDLQTLTRQQKKTKLKK